MSTYALRQPSNRKMLWALVFSLLAVVVGMGIVRMAPSSEVPIVPCRTCSSCVCPKTLGALKCLCPR